MKDIDEAIQHCLEKADELSCASEKAEIQGCDREALRCAKCAADHRQLAKWLKELKKYRREHSETTCEYCQSDSDGVSSLDRKGRVFISPAHHILEISFKDYTGRIDINYCPMCGRRIAWRGQD